MVRRARGTGSVRALVLLILLLSSSSARADWLTETGYSALADAVNLFDGAGVKLLQIESLAGPDAYLPDVTNPAFTGKQITDLGGQGVPSWHADVVGELAYGLETSAAPAVDQIGAQWSSTYLLASLRSSQPSALPGDLSSYDLMNHSWIDSVSATSANLRTVAKFDYQIAQSGLVATVATGNVEYNTTTGLWRGFTHPTLLAYSHNAMVVGVSDGYSSRGVLGDGRSRPDLVAPGVQSVTGSRGRTSWATAQVGSAAALLMGEARNRGWAYGDDPRVIRSALMAGAVKLGPRSNVVLDASGALGTLAGWQADDPQTPLDPYQGAGQLNVVRSWQAMSFGRQIGQSNDLLMPNGYDLNTLAAEQNRAYYFDLHAAAEEFSAVLNWYARVGVSGETWTTTVDDLNLRLYEVGVGGFTVVSELAASTSPVDNIEHLYLPGLEAGRYALVVEGAAVGQTYGLTWLAPGGLLRGDANNDGIVDDADYTLWADGYGGWGGWQDGEWSGDGQVDDADYTLWADTYGAVGSQIPEPGSLSLLLLAATVLLRSRRS